MNKEMMDNLGERLPKELACLIKELPQADGLEEIRIYRGRNAELVAYGERIRTDLLMDDVRMKELMSALSGHALYRFERQMAMGYIPLPGGHRAGVCGAMTRMEDDSWRLGEVTSVCIRVAKRVPEASASIRPYLKDARGKPMSALLLGAPGCGKTTVLRDAALWLSRDFRVAVADEREELFAGSALHAGACLDVLAGMDKVHAFEVLIRSMAPEIIVCDELGREEDVHAVLDAVRCGVRVLASAHADGLYDLQRRPALYPLLRAGAFERYIHLGRYGSVKEVWDGFCNRLNQKEVRDSGVVGCGGDGDDWREQHRLSAL